MNTRHFQTALVLAALGVAGPAAAQIPYDPPTAQNAAPNVFLLLDATRTTLINGETCRGLCHVEDNCGGAGGEWDCGIYQRGETRLQLARRVLTGGWGWNTTYVHGTNGVADARVRNDGIMDQYRVRWGVFFYDGLGTRIVTDPVIDSATAQRAVIDFGQPGYGENLRPGSVNTPLNSYLPFYRTTRCCGNSYSVAYTNYARFPWYNDAANAGARQVQALRTVYNYLASPTNVPQWAPGPNSTVGALLGQPAFRAPTNAPQNVSSIRNDPANVLVSQPPAGCRRNFVIMMTDGHGHDSLGGVSPCQAAADINNMRRVHGVGSMPGNDLKNQVFTVHFGVADKAFADDIADGGYDGQCHGAGSPVTAAGDRRDAVPRAFAGAPGGQINDLSAMYAAFAAIFQLVLSGTYVASPPTITRAGDVQVRSYFTIQDCNAGRPDQCNIGRIGELEYEMLDNDGDAILSTVMPLGQILRSHRWDARNVLTSYTANNTNCDNQAACANRVGTLLFRVDDRAPGNAAPAHPVYTAAQMYNNAQFLRGNPFARFSNGVERSDTGNGPGTRRNPYKLMDIANSQPVVVGAPAGIGEDIERWQAFLSMNLQRFPGMNGNNTTMTVGTRDQVVYIGGNDGLLHAFLTARHVNPPLPGRTTNYQPIPTACARDDQYNANMPNQFDHNYCAGSELWAFSPRLVHPYWGAVRGGHYFMIDGTAVVSDVLFTKSQANPGAVCTTYGACGFSWEYRTVLLQCLGGGGPGCFAMDVTNPFDPRLLWERNLLSPVTPPTNTARGTSTSRPQIARLRRTVGTPARAIPFFAGLMGGGLGEAQGSARRGTFLAVGVEDGFVYRSNDVSLGTLVGPASTVSGDFAGSPTCLDADGDGFTDTCYIATVDASVYKIRIGGTAGVPSGDPSRITMAKFFDGRRRLVDTGVPVAVANNVRSYTRVVATFDANRDLRLFFGTGNFEDVQASNEQNFFFQLIDAEPAAIPSWTDGTASQLNTNRSGAGCGGAIGRLNMPAGEKILFDPVISNGVVLFTSYRPNANACLPGLGYLNGIEFDDCAPGIDTDNDPGTARTSRVGGTSEWEAMPVAPVVNERTGEVIVALDNNTVLDAVGFTGRLQLPSSKLWWRLVR